MILKVLKPTFVNHLLNIAMLNHLDLVAEKVLPSGLPQNSYPDLIQYTTMADKISPAALQENIRLYPTWLFKGTVA
jgi:hypothetical protein